MGKWHRQSAKQVLSELEVDPSKGLSSDEAAKRLEKYGRNELESGKKINPLKLFIAQFNDILIIILIIAALVSLGLSFVSAEGSVGGSEPASAERTQAFLDINCAALSPEDAQSGSELFELVKDCEALEAGEATLYCEANGPGGEVCQVREDHDAEGVTESLLIFGIVLAIAIIGFLNEYKAERTVEALKKLVGHSARVRRDGKEIEVPAGELVPGDIVILEEGQKAPADIRLLEVRSLQVNESSLTGESVPISKNTHTAESAAALGDQKNMLFSGTIITTGTGEGVVVETGSDTEIGKIAHMVSEVEEEQTPMQRKLDDLGRKLGAIILAISILVFVIIFFLDSELQDSDVIQRLILAFTAAVALAVAAIPEGLAFVVRISLALGARRMAAKNALVRKLSAVEALGSTDIIASDKTGTLTRGEMTVRRIYTGGKLYSVEGTGYDLKGDFTLDDKNVEDLKKLEPILRVGTLCNNAHIKDGQVLGDPTEGALVVSAAKAGLDQDKQNSSFKRVDEVPFSSERKMMSTVHAKSSSYLVATKGAPDVMLDNCSKVFWNGKVQKLTPKIKKEVLAINKQLASEALRVLGFAYKEVKSQPKGKSIEKDLIFLGLQGMMDPPRQEVKEVMHRIHAEAGMRVLMITGDYIETAKAVADEIGIKGEAISGTELDELSQAEFEKKVEKISVYARVNPEHKIRIVQALKKHGHQVAMTGDGVNDAPAIKAADIGIAMGVNGTDAAKEASDLILLDDQFLTIIDAIEEGRGIFDNVRKFVNYLLSANISEVITILGGVVLLGQLVLSAAQLLFINIVTDGLPAVALGSDPAEKGIMRFKPHRFQSDIINRRIWYEMIIFGFMMSVIVLIHYWYIDKNFDDTERAVAIAFASMVVYEMVRLVNIRSEYNIKWFDNPWLSVALAGSLALLLSVIYIDPVADVFEVTNMHAIDWLFIGLGSLFLFFAMKYVDILLDKAFVKADPQFEPEHYERV